MTFGFPWYLSIIPVLIAGLLLLIAAFLELEGIPVVRQP